MTLKKLAKIERELRGLKRRLGSIRSDELASIARSLGREKSNRGKEPTYVRAGAAGWFPLSIPNHPGTLPTGTANSIVNQLLDDVEAWRAEVELEIEEMEMTEEKLEAKEDDDEIDS